MRKFHHINLAVREAQVHLIELLSGWITRLDLRWSRWDYNIDPAPFWNAVDPTQKIQFAYFEGLYRVLDTLMARHPRWMVESCASGGRRLDLGTMRRAHTYWFSDQTVSPQICRYMQARANRFLPGHLLNSSVAVGNAATDDGFDDTAIVSRMLGKLAFDGCIDRWSPALTARMAGWVSVFKEIRHLLVQDYYQLLAQPQSVEDWDAAQFISYVGDEAIVFIFAGNRGGDRRIRLRGLQPDRTYAVRRLPAGEATTVMGSLLMEQGVDARLEAGAGGLWSLRS